MRETECILILRLKLRPEHKAIEDWEWSKVGEMIRIQSISERNGLKLNYPTSRIF